MSTTHATSMHVAVRWAALVAIVFTASTYLAPLVVDASPTLSSAIRAVYAPICHQNAERCIPIAGAPQAVCARCAGLYLGGALGLLVAPWLVAGRRRLAFGWLVLACAPTAIDALLPWVGLPQLPAWPRLLVSVPAGLAAGLFVAVGVDGLARELTSGPRGARLNATPLEDLDA